MVLYFSRLSGFLLVVSGAIGGLLLAGFGLVIWLAFHESAKNRNVREQLERLWDAVSFLWYWIAISLWLRRFRMRSRVHTIVFAIFSVAAVFTVLEISLKLVESITGQVLIAYIAPAIPKLLGNILHSSKLLAHAFYESPIVLIFLGLIELMVIRHHRREHRMHGWPRATLAALGQLLHPLTQLNEVMSGQAIADDKLEKKKEFWANFAATFVHILSERGVAGVDITLMRHEPSDDKLRIIFSTGSPERLDHDFVASAGEGAAGHAFRLGNPVYIPSIQYVHGIEIRPDKYVVQPKVYVNARITPFESLLCLPIMPSTIAGTGQQPLGVLNISCDRKDSLSELELAVSQLGAEILALVTGPM